MRVNISITGDSSYSWEVIHDISFFCLKLQGKISNIALIFFFWVQNWQFVMINKSLCQMVFSSKCNHSSRTLQLYCCLNQCFRVTFHQAHRFNHISVLLSWPIFFPYGQLPNVFISHCLRHCWYDDLVMARALYLIKVIEWGQGHIRWTWP